MTKKKYRRPDGSTYEQYGGPKSAQDVEVKETPAPTPTPTPTPKAAAPTTRQTASGARTAGEQLERVGKEQVDEAVAKAKDTEKLAPWLGKKIEQQSGGLGGASKRAVEARKAQEESDLPADVAGDAVAESQEKDKKKKKNGGGY